MGVPFYVGKNIKVFIRPLLDGVETEPTPFTAAIAGLYSQSVTIDTGATSGTFGVTVSSNTVTTTATAERNTPAEIAADLVAKINADTTIGVSAGGLSGATFNLYKTTTFTATAGGTAAASISVGTTSASATAAHGRLMEKVFLSSALPSGAVIIKGEYLGFEDANGKTTLVQCMELVQSTGSTTSFKCKPIPDSIAVGAIEETPYRLAGRTNANLARGGNRQTSVTFDDDAFERGLTTTKTNGLTFNGNWVPTDPGYATAEALFWGDDDDAFDSVDQFYFWFEMPNTNKSLYSKGRVYKGPGSITNMPLEGAADGIITGNIEAALNGKPKVVAPVPL